MKTLTYCNYLILWYVSCKKFSRFGFENFSLKSRQTGTKLFINLYDKKLYDKIIMIQFYFNFRPGQGPRRRMGRINHGGIYFQLIASSYIWKIYMLSSNILCAFPWFILQNSEYSSLQFIGILFQSKNIYFWNFNWGLAAWLDAALNARVKYIFGSKPTGWLHFVVDTSKSRNEKAVCLITCES